MASSNRDEITRLELLHAAHPEGLVFPHLADAYRRAGRFSQAETVLDDGLRRHSDYSSAHVVLGRLKLDQGKPREAEAAFRRVLQLDPENQVALEYLAHLAAGEGRLDEALAQYRRLTRLGTDPDLSERVADLERRVAQQQAAEDRPGALPAAPAGEGRGGGRWGGARGANGGRVGLDPPGDPRERRPPSPSAPGSPPVGSPSGIGADLPSAAPSADRKPRSAEPGEVVTETMAELYARQGLFDRAGRVYRQLLGRNPGDARLHAKLEAVERRAAEAAQRAQTAPPSGATEPTTGARAPRSGSAPVAPPGDPPAPSGGTAAPPGAAAAASPDSAASRRGAVDRADPSYSDGTAAETTIRTQLLGLLAWSPARTSGMTAPARSRTAGPWAESPRAAAASDPPLEPAGRPDSYVQPSGAEEELGGRWGPTEEPMPDDASLGALGVAQPAPGNGEGAGPEPEEDLEVEPGFEAERQAEHEREHDREHDREREPESQHALASEEGAPAPKPATPQRPEQDGVSARAQSLIGLSDMLVGLLEYRDPFFRGGSSLTRLLATSVAEELGLGAEEQMDLALAAVLRDLGRLAMGGRLLPNIRMSQTPQGRRRIERHVDLSLHLMEGIELSRPVRQAVRHHHERWDGAGYPDALAREDIPLLARILAVVDSFAAMVSPRPYRLPLKVPEAARELQAEAGTRYDPDVVQALMRVLSRRDQPHLGFVQRHHILIVTPDQPGAVVTAAKLCSAGYLAEVAVDADTARGRMRRVPVAALVVSAEASAGVESIAAFIRDLRIDPQFSGLPIVVADADGVDLRVRLLESGADVCFPSGLSYGELQGTLGALVRRALGSASGMEPGLAANTPWLALQGDIQDFPLTWLLQVMKYDSRTAAIGIRSRTAEGAVYLRHGDAIHAQVRGGGKGEPALREMLNWRKGRFTVRPDAEPKERTIRTSIMHLLLTQAVEQDHAAAGVFGAVTD